MSRLEDIQKVCLRRGIIFPTAEIYSTISGFFDYGPVGSLLKKKVIEYWREFFIRPEEKILEIEGSTLLPKEVFLASGHLKSFVDPITQCKKCKSIFRADQLIETKTGEFVEGKSVKELTQLIKRNNIRCPRCNGELSEVRLFNLMLKTEISPVGGREAYLRPETAQNIFISFQRILHSSRAKLPFGIAQVGRSFRNEISPRHFIVRIREFSQCEIEIFYDPENPACSNLNLVKDKKIRIHTRETQKLNKKPLILSVDQIMKRGLIQNEWMVYFLAKEFKFYKSLGIPEDCLRFRHMLPEETPHYSKANFDLEIKFDFGWKETVGNAYRGDYDLKKHMKYSGKDLRVLTEDKRKIIPHVFECSFGVDRTIAGILLHCFVEDKKRGWNWFKFPPRIAPFSAAVFPLVNKNGLLEKAEEVYRMLKKEFDVFFDVKGSIGRRYARSDEVGTPFAITIDYQTLEDQTCTIRNRDDTSQVRIKIKDIPSVLLNLIKGKLKFEELKKS